MAYYAETEIELFVGENSDSLLPKLKLFVDACDIVVQLWIWLYFLLFMVDHPQLNLHAECGMGADLPIDFNDRKILEITATLHYEGVTNLLREDEVVMTSQNEINALHSIRQFDIIVLHHVSEGDDHVTFQFLSQLDDHLPCKNNEVEALTDFLVEGVKGVDPLGLGKTEYTHTHTIDLQNAILFTLGKPSLGALVIDIAEQPGKVCHFYQLHDLLQPIVQFVITEASDVNAKRVQGLNHVHSFELRRQQCGGKDVPRKKCQMLGTQ